MAEWKAEDLISPLGNEPIILQLAELNATLANTGGLKRKDGKPWQASDFIPGQAEDPEPEERRLPTQEELRLKSMRMVAAMGGEFRKKK